MHLNSDSKVLSYNYFGICNYIANYHDSHQTTRHPRMIRDYFQKSIFNRSSWLVCVRKFHVIACRHTGTSNSTHTYIHIHSLTHTHKLTYTHIYVHVHTHTQIHTYIHILANLGEITKLKPLKVKPPSKISIFK